MSELSIVAFNVFRTVNSIDSIKLLFERIECIKEWHVLFVFEADSRASHDMDLFDKQISGHSVWRYWPGTGSCSMIVAVNRSTKHLYRNIHMHGRTISVDLYKRGSTNMRVVGWHGMHGVCTLEGICELRAALAKKRPGAASVVVGDINIDLLPSSQSDPYVSEQGRAEHHAEGRAQLGIVCNLKSLDLHIADEVHGIANTKYDHVCMQAPVTRIPSGEMSGLPSILDSAMASFHVEVSGFGSWNVLPSDHACMFWKIRCELPKAEYRAPSSWRCRHITEAIDFASRLDLHDCNSFEKLNAVCLNLQTVWKCTKSRQQRRRERERESLI